MVETTKLLNRLERHTAYIIMLAELRGHAKNKMGGRSWFCYLIWDTFKIEDSGFSNGKDYYSIARVMKFFPELYNLYHDYRPHNKDFELREGILTQCIKATA